jgi:hypothetical protein
MIDCQFRQTIDLLKWYAVKTLLNSQAAASPARGLQQPQSGLLRECDDDGASIVDASEFSQLPEIGPSTTPNGP